MTEQEALELFKHSNYMSEYSWQDDMAELAIKALEKQIPKDAIFVHPLQEDDGGDYMCPTCKSGTVYDAYGNKPPYCHYCGQALKWE